MGTTGGTGGNTKTSAQSTGTSNRGGVRPPEPTPDWVNAPWRSGWHCPESVGKATCRSLPNGEAFKEDIENYLCDRPVMAKPPNPITTAVKFVRRNRYKVSTAVLSMGVFSAGACLLGRPWPQRISGKPSPSELESDRETILIDTLTDLSAFMSGKADRKLRTIVGTTDARRTSLSTSNSDWIAWAICPKEAKPSPLFNWNSPMRGTYADVLGGFSANLGRTEEALSALEQAILLRKTTQAFSSIQDHTLALAELNQRWTQIKHDASLVQGRLPSGNRQSCRRLDRWRLCWNKLPTILIRAISKFGGWTHWPIWRQTRTDCLRKRTTFR